MKVVLVNWVTSSEAQLRYLPANTSVERTFFHSRCAALKSSMREDHLPHTMQVNTPRSLLLPSCQLGTATKFPLKFLTSAQPRKYSLQSSRELSNRDSAAQHVGRGDSFS